MSEAEQLDQDRKALEAFVVNNADLERLEALLDRFNIFEAVGLVRQEIRHSTFLAFLLDPRGNHSLGDAFAKRLLQETIMAAPDTSVPVTPIELSLWDLGQMEVRREWQHIDMFLLDERNRLAVIIENKIDTTEHSDQLQRYHEIVKHHFPGYRVVGLYLTPAGEKPSHKAYVPLGYSTVCEMLDRLSNDQAITMEPDVRTLIAHYAMMLRRHIVGDSEIKKLCLQIYQDHRQAIDEIFKHIPSVQVEVRSFVQKLISDEPRLILDRTSKTMINFAEASWDSPVLLTASGWTPSKRVLLFEFRNGLDSLDLRLYIGPATDVIRQKLLGVARDNPSIFDFPSKSGNQYSTVFFRSFLTKEMYEIAAHEERKREIQKKWDDFLENDLPRIDAVLKNESWIWESSEPVD